MSIQTALEMDDTPVQDVQEVTLQDPSSEALRRLSGALDTITKLEQTNQKLLQEVSALRERLEEGDPNADELRRMNAFLMGELEGARAAAEPKRPMTVEENGGVTAGPVLRVIRWLEKRLRR